MKVTFLRDYGVFNKDGTYEVPEWLGKELIQQSKAAPAKPGAELSKADKVMKPSQVKRR